MQYYTSDNYAVLDIAEYAVPVTVVYISESNANSEKNVNNYCTDLAAVMLEYI